MAAPEHISKQFVKFFFTSETAESRPSSWEIALHTGNPGADGESNEVSGLSYSRQPVDFETYPDPEGGGFWEAQNTDDVTFAAGQSGDSYRVSHYTIRDGSTGDCLAVGQLTVPIQVDVGVVVSFPKEYIKVRGV